MKNVKMLFIVSIDTEEPSIKRQFYHDPELKMISDGMSARYGERQLPIKIIQIFIDYSPAVKNVATKPHIQHNQSGIARLPIEKTKKSNIDNLLGTITGIVGLNLEHYLRAGEIKPDDNIALITIAHGMVRAGVHPYFLASLVDRFSRSCVHFGLRFSHYMVVQCSFGAKILPTDQSFLEELISYLQPNVPVIPKISSWKGLITVAGTDPRRRIIADEPRTLMKRPTLEGKLIYHPRKQKLYQVLKEEGESSGESDTDTTHPVYNPLPLRRSEKIYCIVTRQLSEHSQFDAIDVTETYPPSPAEPR